MRKSNVALAICLLIQGCAFNQDQKANFAEFELVGRRRAEIMSCVGIPDRVEKADGKEFAIYSAADRHMASGVVIGTANCTVSIVFEADRVLAVNYVIEDPGVLAQLEACGEIVSACLRY